MREHEAPHTLLTVLGAAILAGLLVLPAVARPTTPDPGGVVWERLGQEMITHAPIVTLSVDPYNLDSVLAGAYHDPGLYRTANGGGSWTSVTGGLEGLSVFALQRDPGNRQQIYLGSTNGLYRSTDGGDSWERVAEDLPYAPVYALAMDHRGRLYMGTDEHGLYLSTDAGENVAPMGEALAARTILSLALDQAGQTILASSSGEGLYISRDAGASWSKVTEVGDAFVSYVALDADGMRGFACSRDGLWRTLDNGYSWLRCDTDVHGRVNVVSFHPRDNRTLYAGTATGNVYYSSDGGDHWEYAASLTRAIYAIVVHPGHPERLYAGAWDGVYVSSDGGLNWTPINRGLGSVPIDALVMDQQDPRLLYAGNTYDGVYKSEDGGVSWARAVDGLEESGRAHGVLSLAAPASSSGLLYAGTDGRGVYVSADGGETWAPAGTGLEIGIGAIAVHPEDHQHVYVRAFYDRVYESNDGGLTWQPRWEGMSNEEEIISLAIDTFDPSILYAGSEDGLYVTTNGAASWIKVGLEGRTVYCVAVHDQDRNLIYAGTTDGLFRSNDGGQSWYAWGEALSGITISALVLDSTDPHTIYAGTKYHGCFRSDDGGRTWFPSSDGLLSPTINTLLLHPDGGLLFAATPDGVYRGTVK
jgi:photosystem II stability/assembly factor-like uncharacterized protein